MFVSRRTALKTFCSFTAFTALPAGFLREGRAQPGPPRLRYEVRSTEGARMLDTYARAVKIMDGASPSSPSSWTFQWYTHWVNGNVDKLDELNRVFGAAPNPTRDLANLMWSSCEAHGPAMSQPNFLPWHRALLLCFEGIVRRVSGDDRFTLPYWDYAKDATLPEPFRRKGHHLYGALYVDDRKNDVNGGLPIDHQNPGKLALLQEGALAESSFLPHPLGAPQGFSEALDNGLHGHVHVDVGLSSNMGAVPFAAKDPIFWLHHCNIDRLWAAWNSFGGQNPPSDAWLKGKSHVFADASGAAVRFLNADVATTQALGYGYDAFPERPPSASPVSPFDVVINAQGTTAGPGTQLFANRTVASSGAGIELGTTATAVTLTPSPSIAAGISNFSTAMKESSRRQYLVFSDIRTNVQPGTVYNVFAGSPSSGSTDPRSSAYVGSLQFFGAPRPGAADGANPMRFVFDITGQIGSGVISDPLSYYIVPANKPDADARPVIGSVQLISR